MCKVKESIIVTIRFFLCWFCCLSTIWLSAAEIAPQRDKIDDVLYGRVKEARVSWWGFDTEDSTKILQAALDSRVPKLIVDAMLTPWITEQLYVHDDQEIVFEKGSVLQAKRGCFHGTNDSLVNILSRKNVTLSGEGAVICMWIEDYRSEGYKKGEWRHGVNIISSENVTVSGLTIMDTGGDAIYIGDEDNHHPCKNIHITGVTCDNNHRQGISVISVEGLLVEKCVFKNTRGTAPAAGIDFEPNIATESLVDCVVRDCVSENNAGCGYLFYLTELDQSSKPISIRIENCISLNEKQYAVSLTTGNGKEKSVRGIIEFIDCRFENSRDHGLYLISNAREGGGELRFKNLHLKECGTADRTFPIEIASRGEDELPIGNIFFDNVTITDSKDRPFLNFKDYSVFDQDREGITGTVTLIRDGKTTQFTIDLPWIKENFPKRWP